MGVGKTASTIELGLLESERKASRLALRGCLPAPPWALDERAKVYRLARDLGKLDAFGTEGSKNGVLRKEHSTAKGWYRRARVETSSR